MSATQAQRKALGDFGERVAARFLHASNIVVLERNWRCSEGEIDMMAYDGSDLVVCEVKTRSSVRFGTPLEAITAEKAQRLYRLGRRWLALHPGCPSFRRLRVDVICVTTHATGPAEVEHVVGVV